MRDTPSPCLFATTFLDGLLFCVAGYEALRRQELHIAEEGDHAEDVALTLVQVTKKMTNTVCRLVTMPF